MVVCVCELEKECVRVYLHQAKTTHIYTHKNIHTYTHSHRSFKVYHNPASKEDGVLQLVDDGDGGERVWQPGRVEVGRVCVWGGSR